MEDDGFTILDLENIILTGTIVQRQKDQQTDETKIVIRGVALCHITSCARLVGMAPRNYVA
jgi:hypothetical protein